ncbi:MAG: PUA domain-containing protein [Thermoprotei archaeon]|jgi:predicted RNA-binding protein (TIGR00451 family)
MLSQIRRIADYQFGLGVGKILFPDNVNIELSKQGRPRRIYLNNKLIATIRARDGYIALTLDGARILLQSNLVEKNIVIISEDAVPFVKNGRNVFVKFIEHAPKELKAGEEVIIVNKRKELIAVGRAILNGEEMLSLKSGLAIKVRRGVED